jgi:lipopolysaccharide export system protein LptC
VSRATLNLVLLGLALVLVSLALWQFRSRGQAPVAAPDRSDYVLRDFELVTLNDQGKESFTVRGPYLQRDIGGRSLSLVKPRFSFPHQDGGRWNARSEAAWVSPGADEVHLLRAVRMVGPPSESGVANTLETARLVVLPDTEQARTDRRVTVTQGASILEGTGLRADLKAKRFELLNQVKGRYVPR